MKALENHAEIRRKIALCVKDLLKAKDLPLEYLPHQREAFENMLPWLRESKGDHRRYFAQATGSGKTYHFVSLAVEATYSEMRTVIVVSNQGLVLQTAREIHLYTEGTVAVGHVSSLPATLCDPEDESTVYARKGFAFAQIVIVVQDSFRNWAKRLAKEFAPHLIIRDEMHWSYTDLQLAALKEFPRAIILGYSATPDYLTTTAKSHYVPVKLDNGITLYADPKRLADTHFGECLSRFGLRQGIEQNVLSPLAWGEIDLTSISLEGIPIVNGPMGEDYDPRSLAEHMEKNWSLVMKVIERLYQTNEYGIRDRPVAAACPSVKCAEEFARVVGKYTKAAPIVGGIPATERQRLLDLFDQDDDADSDETLKAVASVYVLREGWNSRNAEILFMLRGTKSRVLYEQYLGRILRKRRDGKAKIALVIDPRYQQNQFAPLSAPMLYGVPGEQVTRGGILISPRGKRLISPYLPPGVQVKIRITPVEIEHWADKDGFFDADGEKWGSVLAYSTYFKLGYVLVRSRLRNLHSRSGRASNGLGTDFYPLKDVKEVLADRLDESLVEVGPNGTVVIGKGKNKKTLGTAPALTKLLDGVAKTRIYRLAQSGGLTAYPARDSKKNQDCTLYDLAEVREKVSDCDKDRSKVGPNGTVVISKGKNKKTLGTVSAVGKHVGKHCNRVRDAGRSGNLTIYPGKDTKNRDCSLYDLAEAKRWFTVT